MPVRVLQIPTTIFSLERHWSVWQSPSFAYANTCRIKLDVRRTLRVLPAFCPSHNIKGAWISGVRQELHRAVRALNTRKHSISREARPGSSREIFAGGTLHVNNAKGKEGGNSLEPRENQVVSALCCSGASLQGLDFTTWGIQLLFM